MSNIFEFIPTRNATAHRQLITKKKALTGCAHRQVELDELTQTVDCKDCGRKQSAFEFLWQAAMAEERQWAGFNNAVAEKKRIDAELVALKKEKRNLLSSVTRLRSEVTKLELEQRVQVSQQDCLIKIKESLK